MPSRRLRARRGFFAAGAFMCLAMRVAGARGVELIGYIPSYRMSDASYVSNVLPAQLPLLDEVRYFGITVANTGALTTTASNLAQIQTIQQKISALPPAQRPRLDITLGGASASSGFPAIAQSATLQATLAQNVKSLLDQTGAAGVDVDWEHPSDGAELTTRYPSLLARIKQEIGVDRRVYATVTPEKILPKSVFEGPNAVDGVSLMTYDLGWWANDTADPNLGQHSLPEYVADAVNAWTNAAGTPIPRTYAFGAKRSIDAPESKLGVGAPFYGRGYDGSSADLAVAYRDLIAAGTTTDGSAFLYQGSKVWLPGPDLIADRIEMARQHGLQHVIFWELSHDLPPSAPQSLLRAAYEANQQLATSDGDFNADGRVDGDDLLIWSLGYGSASTPLPLAGDATGDGQIDGADFLVWQRDVRAAATARVVAEPAPAALVVAACVPLTVRGARAKRGRRRHGIVPTVLR